MKKTNGFGLFEIILIIVITAFFSCVATGVIMLNSKEVNINNNEVEEDEYLKEFIEVYNTLVSKYYDEIDREGMLEAAEEGMIDFLGDKYTTYLDDNEYNEILEELKGTYNGIGVKVNNNIISYVLEESPASKAGLRENDIIIYINNTLVTDKNTEEIVDIIQNCEENISLTISRNNELINFNVKKVELISEQIEYKKLDNSNIGYMKIEIFSENLEQQVKKGLIKLENQGINSLIIDLRDNIGGYLLSAEETASLFLEYGKVIYALEKNNNVIKYKDVTNEKRNYTIAVLINNNSASAAEILAAALKESYGATLVGVKSYGKGLVQQVASLDSGDNVKVTTAKWLTPNGNCIDRIGITPDYIVFNNENDTNDYQLQKAIELLS